VETGAALEAMASAHAKFSERLGVYDRTVIKERTPADRKTMVKKEDENGNRAKTVIHHEYPKALATAGPFPAVKCVAAKKELDRGALWSRQQFSGGA
jgi:hypothetical protein